jgi:hypothetical protein
MAVQSLRRFPPRFRGGFVSRLLSRLEAEKNPALVAALILEIAAAKLDPASRATFVRLLQGWASHRTVGRWATDVLTRCLGEPGP